MAQELKDVNVGVPIKDIIINVLLYEADLCLIAEDKAGLQLLLNKLDSWCTRWGMKINSSKTKIVHFRPESSHKPGVSYKCVKENLNVVYSYKYLGLIFNEHLDYQITAKMVVQSASQTLGLVIAKSKAYGGMPYNCYTNCMKLW